MSSLRSTLSALATRFAASILGMVRSSSLDEILGSGDGEPAPVGSSRRAGRPKAREDTETATATVAVRAKRTRAKKARTSATEKVDAPAKAPKAKRRSKAKPAVKSSKAGSAKPSTGKVTRGKKPASVKIATASPGDAAGPGAVPSEAPARTDEASEPSERTSGANATNAANSDAAV